MRKQFLYIDKAGYYYNAPGNISIGAGSKGTVFFWYYPAPGIASGQPIWEARCDNDNTLQMVYTGAGQLSFGARSNGAGRAVDWGGYSSNDHQHWMAVVCTWDFTTAGAGKLRMYLDGQEAPMRIA